MAQLTLVTFQLCNFWHQNFVQKTLALNVDEIDGGILNDLQIRREMDDKLRLERNSLKEALDATHAGDKERAIETTR